ncbi:MAG TPA: NusG domain II-containing protein [Patescibacteria group bacterium]|nr:NusG domain II-containing protein [Patescibacteria group bacterium]
MLTRADKGLIGILLVLALGGIGLGVLYRPATENGAAEISVAGQLVRTVPLRDGYREDIRLEHGQHFNLIEVRDRQVRIREADCPDQICVRAGWASLGQQQIVCLPHLLVIKIVPRVGADAVDDIAR